MKLTPKFSTLQLLSVDGYRPWLSYSVSEAYAGAVASFAVILIAYDLSGSATAAGALETLRMSISYGLALAGGLVVDSYDRRQLMLIRAALSMGIWAAIVILALFSALSFFIFSVLACASTVIGGLLGAASESALRSLVSGENYVHARGINEARDASSRIIGSPIAGFLHSFSQVSPFIFSSLGYLIALVTALRLPHLPPKPSTDESDKRSKEGIVLQAVAGFRWLSKSRQMIALTVLAIVISVGVSLLMTTVTLLLLSRGVNTSLIGIVITFEAVGVILGSAFVGRLTKTVATGRLILITNIASILCLAPIVFHQGLILISACFFFWGLTIPASNASLGGYLFQMVPTDIQGRVVTAHTVLIGVPVAVTAVLAGKLVDVGGGVVGIGLGVLTTCVALIILLIERSIIAIPLPSQWPQSPPK